MSDVAGRKIHPLIPPLALAVCSLAGTALVIGFGDDGQSVGLEAVVYEGGKSRPEVVTYGGGKEPLDVVKATISQVSWLARKLGPSTRDAPLERRVAPGFRVTFTPSGYRISRGRARLERSATRVTHLGRPTRFQHGVGRRTPFGADATVLRGSVTSAYIVVARHRGRRLWTWRLETNLQPRLRPNGSVLLAGPTSLVVKPPKVFDRTGSGVTPGTLRWQLARDGRAWRLALLLDDRRLPLPYTISG